MQVKGQHDTTTDVRLTYQQMWSKIRGMGTRKVKPEIYVAVVMDKSGSMLTAQDKTISGYNEYLLGLRADKKAKYWVTLTQFDTEVVVSYANMPLKGVKNLTRKGYEPSGMTALHDAIVRTINTVKTEAGDRNVLVLILTDGQENSSKEHTVQHVNTLVTKWQKKGWTFVFLGANMDSWAVGRAMGIAPANRQNYAVGKTDEVYAALAVNTGHFASNRASVGMNVAFTSESFFNPQEDLTRCQTKSKPTTSKTG